MPPKKAGKKSGKAKGKKKKPDDTELTLEDKYKKTLDEIDALKDQLANRKELMRRAQCGSDDFKQKMKVMEGDIEEHKDDQRAISADMTRQYKTMQTEMRLHVHTLETQLTQTRQVLSKTETELKSTQEEKERISQEKDLMIQDLQKKIGGMERAYETILHDALNSLIERIDLAKHKWEEKSTVVQSRNKQILLEFGLNPLDI